MINIFKPLTVKGLNFSISFVVRYGVWCFKLLFLSLHYVYKSSKKQRSKDSKTFFQYTLVQAARVDGKVKQRSILYLGSSPLLKDKENRNKVLSILKSKIFGIKELFCEEASGELNQLASFYYEKYCLKYGNNHPANGASIPPAPDRAEFHNINIKGLDINDVKTFGAEHLCKQVLEKLELKQCFTSLGMTDIQADKSLISIASSANKICSCSYLEKLAISLRRLSIEQSGVVGEEINRQVMYLIFPLHIQHNPKITILAPTMQLRQCTYKNEYDTIRAVIAKAKNGTPVAITKADYYPFGSKMPNRTTVGDYRYSFQRQELDQETGMEAFELRLWDGRIGRWLTVDPYGEFFSPYLGMGSRPTVAIDPDGGDIIILGDSEAAFKQGHAAVLIGNEKDGWRYVSINGTGEGARPWGKNVNPDLGENLIGKGLTETELIAMVNEINTTEKHNYDKYIRIKTSASEDKAAYIAAKEVASVDLYGICYKGKSCIDPPKAALNTLLDNRARMANRTTLFGNKMDGTNKTLAGMNKLIPNDFINNLNWGLNLVNQNLFTSFFGNKKTGYIEVGELIQLSVDPNDN